MAQQTRAIIGAIANSDALATTLSRTLTGAGYEIRFYTNIRQAETKLGLDKDIDLLILPLGDKNGADLAFLRQLRRNPRFQYLPVIMLCEVCEIGRVKEAQGQGASAIVTLPLAEMILLSRIEACLKSGRRAVLLVDDEPTILDILKLSLELERFKVFTALDAESALELLEENTVHAVVSDIQLPGMNGLEFLVKCKDKWPGLPVILMTGHAGRFVASDAVAAGADGYFTKPFKNVEIIKTLRQVMAHAPASVNAKSSGERTTVKQPG